MSKSLDGSQGDWSVTNHESESNSSNSYNFEGAEYFLADDDCVDGGTITCTDSVIFIKEEPAESEESTDNNGVVLPLKIGGRGRKGRIKDETPEQREARLAKMSAYTARRLANETPEQRAKRLRRMSDYSAKRLSSETPEKRAMRLARMSAYTALRLASETTEQRNQRLARMSAYAQRKKKNQTFIIDADKFSDVNDSTEEVIIYTSGES